MKAKSQTYKRCLMILADGARADVMEDLLQRGKLSSIRNHLVQTGSFWKGITSFPSTTGPAYLPYLTGCYPGTCNLPGIRWFDKECYATRRFSKNRFRSYVGPESLYMNQDLSPGQRTLFELIPRSFNVFSAINRGVSFCGDRSKFSRIWYWYYSHLTDHWGIIDEAAEAKALECLKEDFEFLFVVFPGVDEFSHLASPFHPTTLAAYERLDKTVGRFVQKLEEEGKWKETMVFIVSDHGLSETQTHLPLNQFLEGEGISTLYYPKVIFRWGAEAASMVSGNGMANLYFQNNGTGWHGRTFWEDLIEREDKILEKLLARPEVDLMGAQKKDGAIVVRSRRGEAVISVGANPGVRPHQGRHTGLPLQYRVRGTDPFGYPPLPEEMTDRELLEKTAETDYPDAPAQLLQIFRSERAGDLILSASKGCDLRQRYEDPEHKSSHGSLHREHMRVPVVTNVKLPESSIRAIRSVDLFPTILRLLGRPIPPGIDGTSLI